MRGQPSPTQSAREAELIENLRGVIRDPLPQNPMFPGVCGSFKALQLVQNLERAALPGKLRAGSGVLPAQEPAHELGRRDRLHLFPQFTEGEPVDAREETALAPFDLLSGGARELAAKNRAGGFETQQGLVYFRRRNSENFTQFSRCRRPGVRHPTGDHGKHDVFLRRRCGVDLGQRLGERSCGKDLPEYGGSFRAHPICAAILLGTRDAILASEFIEICVPLRKRLRQTLS